MKKNRFCAVLVMALALGTVLARPAFAEQDTGRLVMTKLFRGMINAATGWIEIPKQISQECQASGPAKGWSWGFVKGIGFAVARSVVGAYEITTFPVPAPEEYRPILQPEYVLSSNLPENPQPR